MVGAVTSGPAAMSCRSGRRAASSASSKTARASGYASARPAAMPTDWLPCPGKSRTSGIEDDDDGDDEDEEDEEEEGGSG